MHALTTFYQHKVTSLPTNRIQSSIPNARIAPHLLTSEANSGPVGSTTARSSLEAKEQRQHMNFAAQLERIYHRSKGRIGISASPNQLCYRFLTSVILVLFSSIGFTVLKHSHHIIGEDGA